MRLPFFVPGLDEFLGAFISRLFRLYPVRKAEILLLNKERELVPVAAASKAGKKDGGEIDLAVQSWVMGYPVSHTRRRVPLPEVYPRFSVPLVESGGLLGFLSVQLSQFAVSAEEETAPYFAMGQELADRIRQIMLKGELRALREELHNVMANQKQALQRATSLSKDLYAISAISKRINQSPNPMKSLRKTMVKIREVFKVSSVIIYLSDTRGCESKFFTSNEMGAPSKPGLPKALEATLIRDMIVSQKPVVWHNRQDRIQNSFEKPDLSPYGLIIAAPFKAKGKVTGALLLLLEKGRGFNQDSLRLLSGIADIVGTAVDNMNHYSQSLQKKRELALLLRSIEEFNKNLDLKETLKSVSEKVASAFGKQTTVYLLSETRVPMVQVAPNNPGGKKGVETKALKRIEPEALRNFYHSFKALNNWLLFRDIARSRKIGAAAKSLFLNAGVHSILAVPLRLRDKVVGLLLLCNCARERAIGRQDIYLAKALGSAASVAIHNAQTYVTSLEMSDFLERKISEKTGHIKQIEDKQRIRAENDKDIIFRVNKGNRFVFVNKAMEAMTGYSREEFYRGDVKAEDILAAQDLPRIRDCFRKILKKELLAAKNLECRCRTKSGEKRVISLTVYPEREHSGRIIGLEGVGEDITERKKLEKELKKTKDLALLGEFSSAVAHQIRNPLSNILMGTKLIQKVLNRDPGDSKGEREAEANPIHPVDDRENLSSIFGNLAKGVNDLNQVVTELLEYTKTLKLHPTSQKIDVIWGEILANFKDEIKRNNIEVAQDSNPSLPSIFMDAVLIGQVFQVLLHNAIQAMPEGGSLVLTCFLAPRIPGYAFISVSDSGVGIEPAEKEKIFRPFYTTKDSGTGLGLSLAHRIIEAHRGMIWSCQNPCPHLLGRTHEGIFGVRASPPKGLTIHILLPLFQKDSLNPCEGWPQWRK